MSYGKTSDWEVVKATFAEFFMMPMFLIRAYNIILFSAGSDDEESDDSEDDTSSFKSAASDATVKLPSAEGDSSSGSSDSESEPEGLREDPELPHGSATEAKDTTAPKVSRISFLVFPILCNRSTIHHHMSVSFRIHSIKPYCIKECHNWNNTFSKTITNNNYSKWIVDRKRRQQL